jgi:ascorbate-specific PTS system EIIC-type component UlaA
VAPHQGFPGKLFGLVFLVGVLIMLPSIVVTFFTAPSQADYADIEALRRKIVVATAIQQVITVILYPLLYTALTIAYYDLRIRKEGFDLDCWSPRSSIPPRFRAALVPVNFHSPKSRMIRSGRSSIPS